MESIENTTIKEIKEHISYYQQLLIDNINKQQTLYDNLSKLKESLKNECMETGHNYIDEVYYDGHKIQHTYKCSICDNIR